MKISVGFQKNVRGLAVLPTGGISLQEGGSAFCPTPLQCQLKFKIVIFGLSVDEAENEGKRMRLASSFISSIFLLCVSLPRIQLRSRSRHCIFANQA